MTHTFTLNFTTIFDSLIYLRNRPGARWVYFNFNNFSASSTVVNFCWKYKAFAAELRGTKCAGRLLQFYGRQFTSTMTKCDRGLI